MWRQQFLLELYKYYFIRIIIVDLCLIFFLRLFTWVRSVLIVFCHVELPIFVIVIILYDLETTMCLYVKFVYKDINQIHLHNICHCGILISQLELSLSQETIIVPIKMQLYIRLGCYYLLVQCIESFFTQNGEIYKLIYPHFPLLVSR